MHHTAKILLSLHFFGVDFSITTPVFWTLFASVLIIFLSWLASRNLEIIPRKPWQNIFEMAIDFIEQQILTPNELSRSWSPFLISIFLYILFNDWTGILPGATPATSNINQTATLAVMIFLVGNFLRMKKHGIKGFIQSLIPEGVSGPILIIMLPIELISQLFKPFSLAIRLFANMSAGHLLLITILGFTTLFGNIAVSLVSIGGAVVIIFFEIFVGFIQAYVFTFLSALLIGESLAEEN